jgi:hypothetical protein
VRYLAQPVGRDGRVDWSRAAEARVVVAEDEGFAAVDLARHINEAEDRVPSVPAGEDTRWDAERVNAWYIFLPLTGVGRVSLGSGDTLFLAHDTAEHGPVAVVEAGDETEASDILKDHFGEDAPPDTDDRVEFFDLDSVPWLYAEHEKDGQPTTYGPVPKAKLRDREERFLVVVEASPLCVVRALDVEAAIELVDSSEDPLFHGVRLGQRYSLWDLDALPQKAYLR